MKDHRMSIMKYSFIILVIALTAIGCTGKVSSVIEMTEENFDELIQNEFIIVEFIPADCDSCDEMLTIIEEIQKEDNNIVAAMMDVEKNLDFLNKIRFHTQPGEPTVIIFSKGDVQDYFVGVKNKEEIFSIINDIKNKLSQWEDIEAGKASFFDAFDFTLKDLDGNEVTLSEINNLIILDFWATWCPPCKAEIPYLVDFYNSYKNRGLSIIGVSSETPDVLTNFIDGFSTEITYPILLDEERKVSSILGIKNIPTTYFISPEGILIKKEIGFADEYVPEFQRIIEENLPR
ncbi:MAG: redoxin domain-containing protein [Candidatus Cloacimonetes bacterium]|nr:redoxin domain-containing protein [Candidatus Cloacimonadota bacterium]